MKIKKACYGVLSDGTKVKIFTVSNGKMSFSASEYGCMLTSINLPNKTGGYDDVLLGFSTLDGCIKGPDMNFGTIVGRFANRIENGSFKIDNKVYNIEKNEGKNTLHGGTPSYSKIVWKGEPINNKKSAGVRFSRISPDGEQLFPGNVKFEITYLLDNENNLTLDYKAWTDKNTPINLTNHAYFNLAGNGSTEHHVLQILSDYYLDVDQELIPTGKFLSVKDTPFDFNKPKEIGKDLKNTEIGYDHCYVTKVFNPDKNTQKTIFENEKIIPVAYVKDPVSERAMKVSTNQEGMQFYSANGMSNVIGKYGREYKPHEAYCLETQCFPNSPNRKEFPSCILKPGKTYHSVTVYGFEI